MTLKEAKPGKRYVVEKVQTGDSQLEAFLFSLGCYSGDEIMVVSQGRHGCVILVKDSRYSVDNALARAIELF